MTSCERTIATIERRCGFCLAQSPQQTPYEIAGLTRLGLARLFRRLGYRRGAEIGVLRGRFSSVLLSQNARLNPLYSIDPWEDGAAYVTRMTTDSRRSSKQRAYERLAPFGQRSVIMPTTSERAVSGFADKSLDFVYIDGDHKFSAVAHDIFEWSKKVRPGGIVAGHDYRLYVDKGMPNHTYECVRAYAAAYRVKPWFVCGKKDEAERDSVRSWFWVKP